MTARTDEDLSRLVHESGEGWILTGFGTPAAGAQHLRSLLSAASAAYASRYPAAGSAVPPLSDDALFDELDRNPHKVRAFVQAVGASLSPPFLALVWRLLQGDSITRIELRYARREPFRIEVGVEDAETGAVHPFSSDSLRDARLLRHVGITGVGGLAGFDGFHPLKR